MEIGLVLTCCDECRGSLLLFAEEFYGWHIFLSVLEIISMLRSLIAKCLMEKVFNELYRSFSFALFVFHKET